MIVVNFDTENWECKQSALTEIGGTRDASWQPWNQTDHDMQCILAPTGALKQHRY